jgi:hypothetical protein
VNALTDRVLELLPDARLHSEDGDSDDVIVWGPPGTGKTTSLNTLLDAHLRAGHEPDRILVNAFTRNATNELRRRLREGFGVEMPWVRTIHSSCFTLLGLRSSQVVQRRELEQFGADTHYELKGVLGQRSLEDPYGGVSISTLGDWCYAAEELRRQRRWTLPEAVKMLRPPPFAQAWDESMATDFNTIYSIWKQEKGLFDFTDMLERVLSDQIRPPVKTLFIDESQDNSNLVWAVIDIWRDKAERTFTFGDDDQCQPPGTSVLTTNGYLNIEDLDPSCHRLVFYARNTGQVVGLRKGVQFRKAVGPFDGHLIQIRAASQESLSTPEHRWLVRWTDEAKKSDVYAVYLMRKGARYRVGWCQLFNAHKGRFHLGYRASHQRADAAWILEIVRDRTEASVRESYFAAAFGLPTICFEPVYGLAHMQQPAIDRLFDSLLPELEARGENCLRALGLDPNLPLWTPSQLRKGGATMMTLEAVNLLSDLHAVGVHRNGSTVSWEPIKVERQPYSGPVYSLKMLGEYPYYIADGLVTHNSIFEFAGADPKNLWRRPGHQFVLSHSYRLPSAIHAQAQQIIRRIRDRVQKDFEPDCQGGEVVRAWDWVDLDLAREGSWLLLCRNRVFLEALRVHLTANGVAFKDRTDRNAGVPELDSPLGLAIDAVLRLQRGEPVARMRLHYLRVRLQDGLWPEERLPREQQKLALVDLPQAGATSKLVATLQERPLQALDLNPVQREYLEAVLRQDGALRVPKLELSTIHCSPPDEPILTKRGPVPIGELRPADRLVSYVHESHRIVGGTAHSNSIGYEFQRSQRPYRGRLIVLETAVSRTRVTPNHRVLAAFDEAAYFNRWVVYIMRRGGWWRVGATRTDQRPYKSGGIPGRLATEQADEAWILSVHESKREALVAEAVIQGQYGLPWLPFQLTTKRELRNGDLEHIHDLTSEMVANRAASLMADLGLSAHWPFYRRKNGRHFSFRGLFQTEAVNLVALTGRVCLPTTDGSARHPILYQATISQEEYDGLVYGLDVTPHRHYVSGGAIVHNSVKGEEADHVAVSTAMTGRTYEDYQLVDPDPENRVFYVAATRARQSLTWVVNGGRGFVV